MPAIGEVALSPWKITAFPLADGPAITRGDLPGHLGQSPTPRRRSRSGAGSAVGTASSATATRPRARAAAWSKPDATIAAPSEDSWDAEFVAYERQRLLDVMSEARGNKSEAARLLGIPRITLCSKLKKHSLI